MYVAKRYYYKGIEVIPSEDHSCKVHFIPDYKQKFKLAWSGISVPSGNLLKYENHTILVIKSTNIENTTQENQQPRYLDPYTILFGNTLYFILTEKEVPLISEEKLYDSEYTI